MSTLRGEAAQCTGRATFAGWSRPARVSQSSFRRLLVATRPARVRIAGEPAEVGGTRILTPLRPPATVRDFQAGSGDVSMTA